MRIEVPASVLEDPVIINATTVTDCVYWFCSSFISAHESLDSSPEDDDPETMGCLSFKKGETLRIVAFGSHDWLAINSKLEAGGQTFAGDVQELVLNI
jgi:hypothetical protein